MPNRKRYAAIIPKILVVPLLLWFAGCMSTSSNPERTDYKPPQTMDCSDGMPGPCR